jgi:hypothetical protein
MNICTNDAWTEASSQRFRERVARMTDASLQKTIAACIYLTTPHTSWHEPSASFEIQLTIAEREMERRAIMQE